MSVEQTDEDAVSSELPTANSVARFLRANPHFFSDHPEVLRDIEIAHTAGDAVSLLERQISTLREENRRLKARFDELVSLATSNDELIKRIHQLAIKLMGAAGPQAIFALLTESLAEEFGADRSRVMIFATSSAIDAEQLDAFVGADSEHFGVLKTMIEAGSPVCGVLSTEVSTAIYGGASNGSAAVIPLAGSAWSGLLAIGSDDEHRFDAEMATEFLAYLADIVTLTIDPWVARG